MSNVSPFKYSSKDKNRVKNRTANTFPRIVFCNGAHDGVFCTLSVTKAIIATVSLSGFAAIFKQQINNYIEDSELVGRSDRKFFAKKGFSVLCCLNKIGISPCGIDESLSSVFKKFVLNNIGSFGATFVDCLEHVHIRDHLHRFFLEAKC